MATARSNKSSVNNKQVISLLLSFGLLAFSLPVQAKKINFQLPQSQQLDDGASPNAELESKAAGLNLAPVGLNDTADPSQTQKQAANDGEGSSDALLKTTVTENNFVPKKSEAASGKTESLVDKGLNKKLGKKVEVAPLALMETDEEAAQKGEAVLDAEKLQMGELWQSTIQRNPDIQFVIQKLQPNSNANHAMAATMRVLGSALFGAMNVAPFMLPGGATSANMLPMMGIQSGGSIIQSLFQDKAEKGAKKHAISQEQATILYTIVRSTADKLVASYREYKKALASLDRANVDLQDLQSMAAEGMAKTPGSALEFEYTLRKQKRELDNLGADLKLYRQQLADLAGPDAIEKLDTRIAEEKQAVQGLNYIAPQTAQQNSGPFVNPLAQPPLEASESAAQKTAAKPPKEDGSVDHPL